MKIVIAGGLGYIGSTLCELYRDQPEHEIIVIDNRFIPERIAGFPEHVQFIESNIADTPLMKRILQGTDLLYMLAATVEAEKSVHREREVWENNFDIPKTFIKAAPESTRILFPSTGNVFGGINENEKFTGLTEKDTPRPKYPYAETKYEMEQYLTESDRDAVIVRFGTNHGYAPGIRFNLVTNLFSKKALYGETLMVHGSGENIRPTVCVKDSARALLFLATKPEASGEIFHVVRESYQIRNLARRVISICQRGAEIEHVAREVPFSSYGLSSEKIKSAGFTFEWDLQRSIRYLMEIFQSLQPRSADAGEELN